MEDNYLKKYCYFALLSLSKDTAFKNNNINGDVMKKLKSYRRNIIIYSAILIIKLNSNLF